MLGFTTHNFQVRNRDIHVLGGDVQPVQAVDETAHSQEQGFGLEGLGIADDDALATAQAGFGHGGLVAHPPGQPQHIRHGLFLGAVGEHTHAAQGLAEGCVVHSDEGVQARGLVHAAHHFLVVRDGDFGDFHRGTRYGVSRASMSCGPSKGGASRWEGRRLWDEIAANQNIQIGGPCRASGPLGETERGMKSSRRGPRSTPTGPGAWYSPGRLSPPYS